MVWGSYFSNPSTNAYGRIRLQPHLPKYHTTSDVVGHVVDHRNSLHHLAAIEIQ